ncbi:hypothetical protein [Streptomyces sp. H23]|uniref:hypothetical protein n=1 Tax=Streptomyces sp. H23 TaxID=2541723 RepID=UPI00142FB5D4|nr:hypothetical protein [Streptomyces sp. H23]
MQEPESVRGTPRRAGNTGLLVFAVTSALFLVALGYLVGSMAGWWAGRDWAIIVAAVVFAGTAGFARLAAK